MLGGVMGWSLELQGCGEKLALTLAEPQCRLARPEELQGDQHQFKLPPTAPFALLPSKSISDYSYH